MQKIIVFLVLFSIVCLSAALQTLVVIENDLAKVKYSEFLNLLKKNGHELTFKQPRDEIKLHNYGEYLFDNLVLLTPETETYGSHLRIDDLLKYIDTEHNVLMCGSEKTSEFLRELGNECGVDFDEYDNVVVDHFNYDNSVDHSVIKTYLPNNHYTTKLLKLSNNSPILYSGNGMAVSESKQFVTKFLTASSTSFTPSNAGNDIVLVAGIQARNNARVLAFGSCDILSNKYFDMPLHGNPDIISYNKPFVSQISKWVFQKVGKIRYSQTNHHLVDRSDDSGLLAEDIQNALKEVNPSSYRIKDEIEFSLVLEEYDSINDKWIPFLADDVQLEFTMLDPYYRITLSHDSNGRYYSQFKVPDVPGIFQFKINYVGTGYSSINIAQQVSVRPYKHNEFERFIPAAYPYYLSLFTMMVGFFVFEIIYLYNK